MGQLKATLVLSKYSLLATLRSPTSVVFSIAFPIFFIIIFGSLVGDKGGPIKVAVSPGCDTANLIYRTVEGLGAVKLVKGLTAAEITAEMKQGTIGTELNIVSDGGLLPHYRVALLGTDSSSRGMSLLRPVIDATLREMDRRVFPKNPSVGVLSVVRVPGRSRRISVRMVTRASRPVVGLEKRTPA